MAKWDQHPDRDETWARQERASIGEERFPSTVAFSAQFRDMTGRDASVTSGSTFLNCSAL